jgi:hypothetical protein
MRAIKSISTYENEWRQWHSVGQSIKGVLFFIILSTCFPCSFPKGKFSMSSFLIFKNTSKASYISCLDSRGMNDNHTWILKMEYLSSSSAHRLNERKQGRSSWSSLKYVSGVASRMEQEYWMRSHVDCYISLFLNVWYAKVLIRSLRLVWLVSF